MVGEATANFDLKTMPLGSEHPVLTKLVQLVPPHLFNRVVETLSLVSYFNTKPKR